jgi:D-sedoheptulose 7-phosphate isomerase
MSARRGRRAGSTAKRRNAAGGPLERAARTVLDDAARAMERMSEKSAAAVAAAAEAMIASLGAGGTIFYCGNGGSAADAQHMAAELAGRYLLDRPPLPAVALTTNTSALTAIGNDYGFSQVFSRQLDALAMPGDVLVAVTTSGGSSNVLAAVRAARRRRVVTVGLTGRKGMAFARRCDHALVVPEISTPRIQESHLVMGHALCELIERALFGAMRPPRG